MYIEGYIKNCRINSSFCGVRETDGDKWRRRKMKTDCHIDP